jgi:hypothetical protein
MIGRPGAINPAAFRSNAKSSILHSDDDSGYKSRALRASSGCATTDARKDDLVGPSHDESVACEYSLLIQSSKKKPQVSQERQRFCEVSVLARTVQWSLGR